MSHLIALIVMLLSIAPTPATSQPTSQPASQPAGFDRRLDAIDARAGAIKDLTADFVQERRSPLLRKPIVSRGTVKSRGSTALWETVEPEQTRMRIDPQTMKIYYPSQKRIEEYSMSGQLGMLVASPLPRLSVIRGHFKIAADDTGELLPRDADPNGDLQALRLTPADAEMAKFVKQVRVLLDAQRGHVLAFEIVDPDDELTTIRFTNIRADTGLNESSLDLNAPSGTKVVKPLEGADRAGRAPSK